MPEYHVMKYHPMPKHDFDVKYIEDLLNRWAGDGWRLHSWGGVLPALTEDDFATVVFVLEREKHKEGIGND